MQQVFPILSQNNEEKFAFAFMHFDLATNSWYCSYLSILQQLSWRDFIDQTLLRFEQTGQDEIIVEFNKLCQMTSVRDYQERFEALRVLVRAR